MTTIDQPQLGPYEEVTRNAILGKYKGIVEETLYEVNTSPGDETGRLILQGLIDSGDKRLMKFRHTSFGTDFEAVGDLDEDGLALQYYGGKVELSFEDLGYDWPDYWRDYAPSYGVILKSLWLNGSEVGSVRLPLLDRLSAIEVFGRLIGKIDGASEGVRL